METTTQPGGKGKTKTKAKPTTARRIVAGKIAKKRPTQGKLTPGEKKTAIKKARKIVAKAAGLDRRGRKGTVFANPKTPLERIGAAVKAARLAAGLRAPDAAKLAKITVGYWHKIERAAVPAIPVHTITAVRNALKQLAGDSIMSAWLAAAEVPEKAKAAKPAKTKKTAGKKKPSPAKKAA